MARSSIFASFLLLALLLLICCFPMPLSADVLPVSISQQVSVSGTANACDPGCQMLYGVSDNGNSFSLANSNTVLPSQNLSQDGSAGDSAPYGGMASVDALASQTSTLIPTNLTLDLNVSDDFSGSSTLMEGSVSADSQYSLVFNLTSPYLVQLTGSITGDSSGDVGFLSGSFDGEIHLTGPGFQFDQAFPASFGDVYTLGPGQYTLDAVAGWSANQSYFLGTSSQFDTFISADFTACTPEPAQVSIILGLLMLAGLYVARRRQTSSGC